MPDTGWMREASLWQVAVVVAVFGIVAMLGVLVLVALFKTMRRSRVQTAGTAARARVDGLVSLGWTRNRQPGARLTLWVMPPDGSAYTTTIEQAIPQLAIPRVQPGAEVPVRIDPRDRRFVVLDL